MKTVVFNQIDPCIGFVLETVEPGTPGKARGTYGRCTDCGRPLHRWNREDAVQAAQRHVDAHQPLLIGGDRDSLVR